MTVVSSQPDQPTKGNIHYTIFSHLNVISFFTHPIMIRLRHHVGNLRPTHPILERHLVRCRPNARRFYRCPTGHIPENRTTATTHCILLLAMPPTAPHHQAHQCQQNDYDRRHGCPNRNAQHFAIDLALGAVIVASARAHLLLGRIVGACASRIAVRFRTGMTFATGALWLIGPRIAQTGRTFAAE